MLSNYFLFLSTDIMLTITWLFSFIYGLNYKSSSKFFLINSMCLIIILCYTLYNIPLSINTLYFVNFNFIHNNILKLLKLILLILIFVFFIMTYVYVENEKLPIREFIVLIFISLQGFFLVLDGNDLIIVFLGIELQSLCFYILIGLRKNSNIGIEAAFKYFILSAYSNMISLYGISLFYGFFGTTKITEINMLLEQGYWNIIFVLGVIFFFVGIFFKLGVFMFHYWIGDVYHGSLLIVTAYFSIVPKVVFVFFFFKLYLIFSYLIQDVCILLSCLSIFYGTFIALYQTGIKRLLAFSSLTHIGYILLGISLGTIEGYVASFFYIFFYIILLIFTFCFLLSYVEKHSTRENFYIDDLSALCVAARKNYFLAVMFSTILLSMAGVPFMAGFFSKFYIFLALYNSYNIILTILVLFISVISAVYYIRLIRFMFFVDVIDAKLNINFFNLTTTRLITYMVVFCFIVNLLLFFFHSYIYMYILNKFLITYFI